MKKYGLARSIPSKLVSQFGQLSSIPTILLIAFCYLLIWAISWSLKTYHHPFLWLVGIFLTGGLQHHLLTLMHEGAHYLLSPSRNWNDRMAQAFCAFPMGMHLKDYRYFHLQHHKHSGDATKDPEIYFYNSSQIGFARKHKSVLWHVVKDFSGYHTMISLFHLSQFMKEKVKSGEIRTLNLWDFKWGLIGLMSVVSVPLLFGFFKFFCLLWFLSLFFVTPLLLRWHSVGEHTGLNEQVEQAKTLTHDFPFVINFFLYPIHSGFHLEHHLFPQVPWFRVPSFRRALLEYPAYAQEAQKLTVNGFWWGQRTVLDIVFKGNYASLVETPRK